MDEGEKTARKCDHCDGDVPLDGSGGKSGRFCSVYCRRHYHPGRWTAEEDQYLRAHYAEQGAPAVAATLHRSKYAVYARAQDLGLRVAHEAHRRVVRERMRTRNPMRNPESVARLREWQKNHPEILDKVTEARTEGRQRIERNKPSGLEVRMRKCLDSLGVAYEPSAIVKDKFVVDARIGTLIIQADGEWWHGHPRYAPLTDRQIAQQKRDRSQDAYLTKCGFTVVRIWDRDMTLETLRCVLSDHGLIPAKE